MIVAQERQDQNAKRRKIEQQKFAGGPAASLGLTADTTTARPPIPERPPPAENHFAAKADSIGLGAPVSQESMANAPKAIQAWGGSNRDVVANRRAIRMANMSAAEVLKAELAGLSPVKPSKETKPEKTSSETDGPKSAGAPMEVQFTEDAVPGLGVTSGDDDVVIPDASTQDDIPAPDDGNVDLEGEDGHLTGTKRTFEEGPGAKTPPEDGVTVVEEEDEDEGTNTPTLALKVNPDGSVEQEDTVKWVSRSYT